MGPHSRKALAIAAIAAVTGTLFGVVSAADPVGHSVAGPGGQGAYVYKVYATCGATGTTYYYLAEYDGVYGVYKPVGGTYRTFVYQNGIYVETTYQCGGGGSSPGPSTPPATPGTPGTPETPETPETPDTREVPEEPTAAETPAPGTHTVVGGQAVELSDADLGLKLQVPAGFAAEGDEVTIVVTKADEEVAAKAMEQAKKLLDKSAARLNLTAAADAFTVWVEGDGIAEPIKAELAVKEGVDKHLVQVFRVNVDGTLTPVRTKPTDEGVTFNITEPGTYLAVEVDKQFLDTANHWSNAELKFAAAHLLVEGYPDGNFRPEGTVTRAEFVAMLVRAMGLEVKDGPTHFVDVPANQWYAGYVKAAVEAGLVKGVDAEHFDPNGNITREQMMALLGRAVTKAGVAKAGTLGQFIDANALSDWAVADTQAAVGAGLVKGMPQEGGLALNPAKTATRAEAAAILARLFGIVD